MQIGTLRQWIGYSVVLVVVLLVVPPFLTKAEGTDADKMCNPFIKQCGCGEKPNPKTGKCEKKGGPEVNTKDCPMYCKDNTNGHTTVGHCVEQNKCKGDLCDGKPCEQNKGEGGKPPEMPKPPESKDSPSSGGSPCGADGASTGLRDSIGAIPGASSTRSASSTPCGLSAEQDKFVEFMSGASTSGSQASDWYGQNPSQVANGEARPTLESYIQQLRGYFGGIPSTAQIRAGDSVQSAAEAARSTLDARGFNLSLADIQQLSLLPAFLRENSDALRVSAGSGVNENSSGQSGGQNQAQGVPDSIAPFRESPATGFLPPTPGQSSPGFFESRWSAVRAFLGL